MSVGPGVLKSVAQVTNRAHGIWATGLQPCWNLGTMLQQGVTCASAQGRAAAEDHV